IRDPLVTGVQTCALPISVVEPVEGGRALVSHQAAASLNPASVMKLVTSYAALELLGPAFVFHTDVLVAGEISAGVLDGDLVIRRSEERRVGKEWRASMAR